jgi:dihydropyrimidinase
LKTLVRGGRVVTAAQEFDADILVEDGKIAAIGALGLTEADTLVDASGKLVFPGGVDPHTHMDTPAMGTVISDDFRSGTVAAAVGGTTTIIDFPIQGRGEDLRVSLEQWFKKAEGKTAIDYAFHQIVTDLPDSFLPAMDDLVKEGISSFKLFMAYPGAWMVDDGTIFKAMQRTAENGGFIMMHCENGLAIDVLVKQAIAEGKVDPIHHARTRPSTAEGEATSRAIALAQMAEVPVYVVHMSAQEAVQAVREARDRGIPAYAETCPHYLLLTEEKLAEPEFEGSKYVCSPPLRSAGHLEVLWNGLRNDDLQVVSTDHAPFYFREQKEMGRGDFSKIPNGIPGVEWRMALLYDHGVRGGRITRNRFVEVTSTNAAKLFGLYPRKGEIAPGSDGDLVVFDPERKVVLSAETQATNCDYNPYEGWTVTGWPVTVLLRGQVVVDDARYVGREGHGEFVRCGESVALS